MKQQQSYEMSINRPNMLVNNPMETVKDSKSIRSEMWVQRVLTVAANCEVSLAVIEGFVEQWDKRSGINE